MNRQLPDPRPYDRRGFAQPHATDPNAIEMSALFAGLRRNKWIILLATLLAAGIAALALKNAQPTYEAYAELLLETRQERVTGIEQVISDLAVNDSVVAGEIAVLRSNVLLGRVVDKLNLIEHPEFNPYRHGDPGMLKRFVEIVMRQVTLWRGLEAEPRPDAPEAGSVLSPEDARNFVIWQVKRNMSVAQSGIAYVIGITARAANPEIAAAIANAIAEQYLIDQQAIKHAATQRAIVWLDNRLAELETQLRAAEDAVVDAIAEQTLQEGGNEASVEQQLAELNRTFVTAQAERAAAGARLEQTRELVEAGGIEAAAVALDSPRLQNLDAEQAALERQKAQLAQRLGRRHPEMLALQSALEDLQRDRLAAIEFGLGEIETELALAREREDSLGAAIGAAHHRLVEFSRSSVRLRQLERSASAMRQVYESFLSRFQETTQQLEFQNADARIITQAEPPLAPSRPRKKLVLIVAVAVGAVLGIAASLVHEVTNRTVRSPADVARVTGLQVLGALPRRRRRGKNGAWLAAEIDSRKFSPYAEELRLLRTALTSSRSGAKPRIVLFTGTEPRVGVSSAVLGLARLTAAIGKRVAVVDADLRRPAMHGLLGAAGDGPDLVDLIEGRAELDDVLVPDPESGAQFVLPRAGRADAAELVSSAAFRLVIDQLVERFDVVLLDAPPASGVADAKVLASIADATVVVARAGRSREDGLRVAIAALEDAGALVMGMVLTHAAPRMFGRRAGGFRRRSDPARAPALSLMAER